MKKFISIFVCAALAFAACAPVVPDSGNEVIEYAGARASAELASTDPVPADGGTLKVTVHKSPAFTVSIPKTAADWLTCSQADSVLTFTAKANSNAVPRFAHVGIIDSNLKISITSFDVVQAGTAKEIVRKNFRVSPEEKAVRAEDTNVLITVESEVAWKAVSNNSAFVCTPSSGEGNGKISVDFPVNTKQEEVTAVITVSTEDEAVVTKSYTVTIKQEAAKPDNPAVKPPAGTVLAEWCFDTDQIDALKTGGIEGVSLEDDNAPGNVGGPYVPSNVSGKGRLEYYNGSDKSIVSTKKVKRRIGERGEPCIYCSWEGDWFIWSAEPEAPLAAGTKLQVNFALRPSHEDTPKYWKCEMLDGDKWVELNTIELDFHRDAAGTADDPKQINCLIKEAGTLTAETASAQFRFTCTKNARCFDGAEVPALTSKYVLRFAGKWSEASDDNKYLQVPENPKIMVVE